MLSVSVISVVAVFVGGLAASAALMAEPAPHQFAHLDAPDLWTSAPVKIDGTKQSYERLPALVAETAVAASDLPGTQVASNDAGSAASSVAGAIDPQQTGEVADASDAAIDTAQADWCAARYRSYRVEDNSYQPFRGGARRQCEPPASRFEQSASLGGMSAGRDAHPVESAELISDNSVSASASGLQAVDQTGGHAQWCMERYRSYRIDDNTYQPFDGGPRRSCQSPSG